MGEKLKYSFGSCNRESSAGEHLPLSVILPRRRSSRCAARRPTFELVDAIPAEEAEFSHAAPHPSLPLPPDRVTIERVPQRSHTIRRDKKSER